MASPGQASLYPRTAPATLLPPLAPHHLCNKTHPSNPKAERGLRRGGPEQQAQSSQRRHAVGTAEGFQVSAPALRPPPPCFQKAGTLPGSPHCRQPSPNRMRPRCPGLLDGPGAWLALLPSPHPSRAVPCHAAGGCGYLSHRLASAANPTPKFAVCCHLPLFFKRAKPGSTPARRVGCCYSRALCEAEGRVVVLRAPGLT
jgi:hypothetical protein